METNIDAAVRHYETLKKVQARYYQKVKEARKAKYKEAHPNPKPKGRPRKCAEEAKTEVQEV